MIETKIVSSQQELTSGLKIGGDVGSTSRDDLLHQVGNAHGFTQGDGFGAAGLNFGGVVDRCAGRGEVIGI